MRLLIACLLILPCAFVAKPVEDKLETQPENLQVADVSPTTLPPSIPTDIPQVDGQPTFEEEIAHVVEGSVENLIPFGASEKPETKPEQVEEEASKQEKEPGFSIIDLFLGQFNGRDKTESVSESAETESTTTTVAPSTTEQPEHEPKLEWLQTALSQQQQLMMMGTQDNSQPNQQPSQQSSQQFPDPSSFATPYQSNSKQMQQVEPAKMDQQTFQQFQIPFFGQQFMMDDQDNSQQMQQVEPSKMMGYQQQQQFQTPAPFSARYQQWMGARQMASQLDLEPTKQDQYSAAHKSKLNWNKLLAEPVDDYKQYIPSDNTVQWSSNEMPADMIDLSQKSLLLPSNVMKNKEQWFGGDEI